MSSVQAIMPNTEKLFMYVQRGFWHNITPSSTGFVKKEYFQYLTELQADEEDYKQLRLMIEHAEMGRYTEAKNLMNDAYTQFQNMVSLVMEKRQVRQNIYTQKLICQRPYVSYSIATVFNGNSPVKKGNTQQ